MRLVVCGGRDYQDFPRGFRVLDALHKKEPITELAQGGARGADDIARRWCAMADVPCKTFEAEWDDGHKAGPIRSAKMLDEFRPDRVLAFPGGKGTRACIKLAQKRGIRVDVVKPHDPSISAF